MGVRFGVIGIDHDHIYGQVAALLAGGAELAAFHAPEDDLAARFGKAFAQAKRVGDPREILEDASIHCIASAAINADRAAIGVAAMRHGKDFLVDKPGVTDAAQLELVRRVQAETKRHYSVFFSERFTSRATLRAGALVREGAIGRVIHTVGLGPHQLRANTRPRWFFERARYGGVLCDIASHQFDQFLWLAGASRGEVVAAHVANRSHPEHPELEDFGEALVRAEGATGYVRVDWFTPDGLGVWGDGRLTILGTDGYIELRKYVDVAGRPGADHLFLVDGKQTRHIDCSKDSLDFGRRFVADVRDRTETAMPQAHCFAACELALSAQARAVRLA
jgi:predicted dehydrogenase